MNVHEKVEGTIPECLWVLSCFSRQTLFLLVADNRESYLVIFLY